MTVFTGKHDEELYEYFAGVLKGRCGLRSSMGGQLEAMASGALHRIPRDGNFMPVKPEDRHANRDFDLTEAMRAAAREIERMERVLAHVDEVHQRMLRAHYVEPTKALFNKLVVVMESSEAVNELIARATSEDRAVRREGRKEMGSREYQAGTALKAAQEAFALAVEVEVEEARQRRRAASLERRS